MKPYSVLLAMNNAPGAWIGMEHSLTGPNLTFSVACSSAAVAIGEAWLRIRAGAADVMLAGGAEAPLTLGTIKAWEALKTLATEDPVDPSASCKPFAKNRSGLVLGEGAAVVVLEEWEHARRRGAPVIGELVGYGLSTDSEHITRPSVAGQARALQLALDSAEIAPRDVGYINAHGTGTLANDAVETAAIRQVFGAAAERIPVSSTKSMHGHLLGAAGAVELDRDAARRARAQSATDDALGRAGSRVRPRLRAERRTRDARARDRADEFVRVRRHQRRAGVPPCLTAAVTAARSERTTPLRTERAPLAPLACDLPAEQRETHREVREPVGDERGRRCERGVGASAGGS